MPCLAACADRSARGRTPRRRLWCGSSGDPLLQLDHAQVALRGVVVDEGPGEVVTRRAGRFDRLGAAARFVASGGRGWRASLGDERVVASRSRRSAMAVAHGCLAGGPGDRCQVFEQVRAAQRVPAGVVVPVQPPAVVHRGAGQGVRSPAWSKRHAPARPPIDVVSCDAIAYLTDGRM